MEGSGSQGKRFDFNEVEPDCAALNCARSCCEAVLCIMRADDNCQYSFPLGALRCSKCLYCAANDSVLRFPALRCLGPSMHELVKCISSDCNRLFGMAALFFGLRPALFVTASTDCCNSLSNETATQLLCLQNCASASLGTLPQMLECFRRSRRLCSLGGNRYADTPGFSRNVQSTLLWLCTVCFRCCSANCIPAPRGLSLCLDKCSDCPLSAH